jgi:glycine dehydrogenase subunit 1
MRYTPHTDEDRKLMLERVGVKSVEELLAGIPADIRLDRPLNLPEPLSEPEAVCVLSSLAAANVGSGQLACFAGAGAYDHYIPAIVDTVISRSEFYTAYTPYQAEVSQGTLQAIYEFQSLVCRLYGMEVANASMYDCASALAEAAHMARDITRRPRVLIAASVNPTHVEVVRTYAHGLNIPIELVPLTGNTIDLDGLAKMCTADVAAVIIQHPNFFGNIEPVRRASEIVHKAGALLVVSADPISLGALEPPGAYGADIAVGDGQPLGIPLSFGGPYLGLMSAKKKYIRNMPGRIVARTVDTEGRPGFVLALQTREQHIRRERATSNICTNQALCALAASVYLATMGRTGIAEVARQSLAKAHYLASGIAGINGFSTETSAPFFKEFVVRTPVPAARVVEAGVKHGILAGVALDRFDPEWKDRLLVAVTERRTKAEMDDYCRFLRTEFAD